MRNRAVRRRFSLESLPSDDVAKRKRTKASVRQSMPNTQRDAGSNNMSSFLEALRLAGIVTILMVLSPAAVHSEESSPDTIEFRWVLAGLESDANTLYMINIPMKAALRTGDKIKMYLKTHRKCFFYLFHQAPAGRMVLLFPFSLPSEAIASDAQLMVPQGDKWFQLGEQTGTETFHVLVSHAPLSSIEALYEIYRQHASESGYSAVRLVSAIERLCNQKSPLTSKVERPLPIGGTIRGASDNCTDTTQNCLDQLAENIVTPNVFCRTYTIEHH